MVSRLGSVAVGMLESPMTRVLSAGMLGALMSWLCLMGVLAGAEGVLNQMASTSQAAIKTQVWVGAALALTALASKAPELLIAKYL